MGWIGDATDHEGWTAPLFSDGAMGSGWSSAGVTVNYGADGVFWPHERWESRPESQVRGWVAACECGWRGPTWWRVNTAADVERAHMLYSASAMLDEAAEGTVMADWLEHVAPFEATAGLGALAAAERRARDELDAAVAEARAVGASWQLIGRETGFYTSRARERWEGATTAGRR